MGYDGSFDLFPKFDDNPDYVVQDFPYFHRLPNSYMPDQLFYTEDFAWHKIIIDYYVSKYPKIKDLDKSCWYFKVTLELYEILDKSIKDKPDEFVNIKDALMSDTDLYYSYS